MHLSWHQSWRCVVARTIQYDATNHRAFGIDDAVCASSIPGTLLAVRSHTPCVMHYIDTVLFGCAVKVGTLVALHLTLICSSHSLELQSFVNHTLAMHYPLTQCSRISLAPLTTT